MMDFDSGSRATYAAMVTRMDEQVGRVLAALERNGLARDTIVVFTSDNGGERFSDTWPFTGRKTELLEGGIRIPAIVRWPGRIAAGSTSTAQIMSMDWLPTLASAAGTRPAATHPPDGIDISSSFAGAQLPERTLFWRYRAHAQRACRRGDWKYLKIDGNEFLFKVANDPLERANFKAREPQRFATLRKAWEAWNATMLPLDPGATRMASMQASSPTISESRPSTTRPFPISEPAGTCGRALDRAAHNDGTAPLARGRAR